MRRAMLLFFAALFAVLGVAYAKVVRAPTDPAFAFLGNAAPHGHSDHPIQRGGGDRTTFQLEGDFQSVLTRARLELRSKGYREVNRSQTSVAEFYRKHEVVSLVQGQLSPSAHSDPTLAWSPHPARISVVVDRQDFNPFERSAWALIAKAGLFKQI